MKAQKEKLHSLCHVQVFYWMDLQFLQYIDEVDMGLQSLSPSSQMLLLDIDENLKWNVSLHGNELTSQGNTKSIDSFCMEVQI